MTNKQINKIVLGTLIGLCILSTIGLLNFGHGLGDIVYIVPIILTTITHLVLTIVSSKRNYNGFYVPASIIFGLLCCLIFYKATIGRGGEFSWDGSIFFLKGNNIQTNTQTEKIEDYDYKTTNETQSCDFEKHLNSKTTPKLAIELYYNKAKYSEEPLSYFEYLKSSDKNKREFYFRVITNSYKLSDGAYSEGLGELGKEFIENNTKNFSSFFDNTECFTEKDLETWADIAILEFSIIGEDDYKKPIVDDFTKKLKINCRNCTKTQIRTIDKFEQILKKKWSEYLAHIDN